MNDRVPTKPNRVKVTHENGSVEYVTWERADEPAQEGTPLNKANLFSGNVENRYGASTPSAGFEKLVQELFCSVPVSGWSSEPDAEGFYTNQVSVPGMLAVYNPLLVLVITSSELALDEQGAFSFIIECNTFDGYVIFKSLYVPDTNINVKFVGV